jgi:hypothetical protein
MSDTLRWDTSIDSWTDSISGRRIPADVAHAIRQDRIIDAIRLWRDFTGEGLLESKRFVEVIMGRTPSGHKVEQPKMPDSANPPKQDLLLKMLRMTESDNDGQALVAIRKANKLLQDNGWSWEKLIHAKITVVEDPFGKQSHDPFANAYKAPMPNAPPPPRPQRTPPRPQPAPAAQPYRAPPSPPPPPPKPSKIFPVVDSTRTNRYPNLCYCCGAQVDALAGFIFNPSTHNSSAIDKWEVICAPCNSATTLAVPNRKTKPKASQWSNVGLGDL